MVTRAVAQTQAVECGPSVGCMSVLAFVGYSGGRLLYGYRRSSIHRGTAGLATIHVSKPINTTFPAARFQRDSTSNFRRGSPCLPSYCQYSYVCIGVCTNPSRGQLQHRPRDTGSPAGTGACAKLHGARIAHRAPGTRQGNQCHVAGVAAVPERG